MQHTVLKPKVDTSFFLSSSGRNSEIMLQEANFPNSTLSLHRFIDLCPVGLAMHFSFFLHTYSIPCKSLCCKYTPLYTYAQYISFVHTTHTPLHSPAHLPKLHPAVVSMRFPITSLYVPVVQLVVIPGYIGLYYTL